MKRGLIVGVTIVVVLLLSGLGVGLYFLLRSNDSAPNDSAPSGAVATSTVECTKVAVEILQRGGSAVDSAVTAILCQGLTVPQSSGLGGGVIATVYIKESGVIETLNAREVAPLDAHKDMYPDNLSSLEGGLAIAVPTELKGLYVLHKKYGHLKWEEVVQPVIELAESGYIVTHYLASIFEDRGDKIKAKPLLRDFFTDPRTGDFYKEGDTIKNPKLANTLKIIAKEGSDAFYGGGELTQKLVNEIRSEGGIIRLEDFTTYEPKPWGKPIESQLFNGDSLYTFPLPATGYIINFIFNIMNGYKIHEKSFDEHQQEKLLYHRLAEAFKFGFAKRSKLGDDRSNEVLEALKELESVEHAEEIRARIQDDRTFNEVEHYGANVSVSLDYGTGHISILAPNGDAVAITSTINYIMGSYVMSESTGIIFNNEMNDFSIPVAESDGLLPAPANFVIPKNSPTSSMSPLIVLDGNKDVTFIAGGAGGVLIMTSVIQVMINYLYLNMTIEDSFAAKRIHHQLQPMRILHEQGYDPQILAFLKSRGHELYEQQPAISGFASVIGVGNKNGKIEGSIDPRRGGKVTVF